MYETQLKAFINLIRKYMYIDYTVCQVFISNFKFVSVILIFRLYSLIVYLILISAVSLSLAIQSRVERYVNHFGKLFFCSFTLVFYIDVFSFYCEAFSHRKHFMSIRFPFINLFSSLKYPG